MAIAIFCEEKPYSPHVALTKNKCVARVQKHMGKWLRDLKKTNGFGLAEDVKAAKSRGPCFRMFRRGGAGHDIDWLHLP